MEICISSHHLIKDPPEFVQQFVCEKTRRKENPDFVRENQENVQEKEDYVREFCARIPGDGGCIRVNFDVFAQFRTVYVGVELSRMASVGAKLN